MSSLRQDQRGSILVPGLCMGTILVLSCMHVIDVAEAILVRAVGQNRADAIALESAVWHAQGMNLLVMINLIMAAVMAVLMAIRIAEIILIGVIAIVLIGGLASIAFFGGAGAAFLINAEHQLNRALTQVHRFEDRVSEPIMRTLTYAVEAERAVAALTPYLAYARPITYSANVPGVALSFSLIPAGFEQKFNKASPIPSFGKNAGNRKLAGFDAQTSFPARLGTLPLNRGVGSLARRADGAVARKVGKAGLVVKSVDPDHLVGSLPVEEEDLFELCARSGELLSALFLRVLGGPADLSDSQIEKVSSFVGTTVGSMQTVACTPLKQIGDTVLAEIDKAVNTRCREREAAEQKAGGERWDSGQRNRCKDEERRKAGWKKPTDATSIKVAQLWSLIDVPKDSPFLHVWATTPLTRFDVDPANTMAEFRHVCDGGNDSNGRSCNENSMWRPGWYAKLVPVRSFGEEFAQKFGDALAGWFSSALGDAVSGVLDGLVQRFVPQRSSKFDAEIKRQLGTALSKQVGNGWWNQRFLSPGLVTLLGVERISLLELGRYPQHLH